MEAKKVHQNLLFSNSSDAFWASHFNSTGLLQPPPPPPFLSQSYSPYTLHKSSQPPLLPLPAAALRRSASVENKKVGSNPSRARDHPLASKKSRSSKKEDKKSPEKSMVARKRENGGGLMSVVVVEQLDIFSGPAAFAISPPPSSLPLPTFPMRPKLSCMAEAAAGVDAGATDDLRRLLRLR